MEPKEQAAKLPEKSGVYMFKDTRGHVIYVGKARPAQSRADLFFDHGEVIEFILSAKEDFRFGPQFAQM